MIKKGGSSLALIEYLKSGKDNAVSLNYLAQASGMGKDRGIARCMERKFSGQIEMELEV